VKKIEIYPDGSCLGNPGVMGFCAILQCEGAERIVKGYDSDPRGTNNKAELSAVIIGLDWVNRVQKEQCKVIIYTDSENNVRCSQHSDMSLMAPERKNNEYWIEYIRQRDKHNHIVEWRKIKGHSNCEQNNRADKIAKAEAIRARHELYEKGLK
jgi:ribonuclease HI